MRLHNNSFKLLLAASFLAPMAHSQPVTFADLEQVVVITARADFNHARQNYVFRRTPSGFLRNGEPFDPQPLRQFVSALHHPPLSQPNLTNLGITNHWLESNSHAAALKADQDFDQWHPDLQAHYISSFRSLPFLRKHLKTVFSHNRFDDYPFVRVTARFRGGRKICWVTTSWHPFLLPWRSLAGQENFDSALSLAVAALLPPRAVNSLRLGGVDLLPELAKAVHANTSQELTMLKLRIALPSAMRSMEHSLKVHFAQINSPRGKENGPADATETTQQETLFIDAHRPGDPPRLRHYAILAIQGNTLPSLDKFMNNLPQASARLRQVPWMRSYLQRNRAATLAIISENGNSVDSRVRAHFRADMIKLEKQWLLDELPQDSTLVLRFQTLHKQAVSVWLLLPNDKLILWISDSTDSIPGLLSRPIPRGECEGDTPVQSHTVGWLFDKQGHLDSRSLIPRDQRCPDESLAVDRPFVPSDHLYPLRHNNQGTLDSGRSTIFNTSGQIIATPTLGPCQQYCWLNASPSTWRRPQREGKWPLDYAKLEDFNGTWGYINRQGNLVWPKPQP